MMVNYFGQMGISVLVVEKFVILIDYLWVIGIDDEFLWVMQVVGLVNDVLLYIMLWYVMCFFILKGCCFVDIQLMIDEFGWLCCNVFIQLQVDVVMYYGLQCFLQVCCFFFCEVEVFSQIGDGVMLNFKGLDGEWEMVCVDWLVVCDGGVSFICCMLNIFFEGKIVLNQWIVIDIVNDLLVILYVYLCCDLV